MSVIEDDEGVARYFFEIGYGACWADAFIKNGQTPPFEMIDADIARAWEIAPECADDYAEFDRNLSLAASRSVDQGEAKGLREALGWFLADDRFQVAVGGNPIVVDGMLAEAKARFLREAA